MAVVDSLSPEVRSALAASGWTPDRRVDVEQWDRVLAGEGYRLSSLAREVLETLGGLRVRPVRKGSYTADLLFEPELAGSGAYDIAEELEGLFGQSFYPVAEWISNSCVFLGDAGKVVSYDDIELLDIADSVSEAMDVTILASRPPKVIRSTS